MVKAELQCTTKIKWKTIYKLTLPITKNLATPDTNKIKTYPIMNHHQSHDLI